MAKTPTLAHRILKFLGVYSAPVRKTDGAPKRNRRGRTYPEQSARQVNRGFRRAQGGPGLDAYGMPRGYYDEA